MMKINKSIVFALVLALVPAGMVAAADASDRVTYNDGSREWVGGPVQVQTADAKEASMVFFAKTLCGKTVSLSVKNTDCNADILSNFTQSINAVQSGQEWRIVFQGNMLEPQDLIFENIKKWRYVACVHLLFPKTDAATFFNPGKKDDEELARAIVAGRVAVKETVEVVTPITGAASGQAAEAVAAPAPQLTSFGEVTVATPFNMHKGHEEACAASAPTSGGSQGQASSTVVSVVPGRNGMDTTEVERERGIEHVVGHPPYALYTAKVEAEFPHMAQPIQESAEAQRAREEAINRAILMLEYDRRF